MNIWIKQKNGHNIRISGVEKVSETDNFIVVELADRARLFSKSNVEEVVEEQ